MARGVNIDPNFVLQQQQLAQMQALKQAKSAGAVSGKKALWIIVPVFVLALAIAILSTGVFAKKEYVRWGGELYRIRNSTDYAVFTLPEGYEPAGALIQVEDVKKASEDLSSDWPLDAQLYVNPSDPQKAYISAYGHYLEIRKK